MPLVVIVGCPADFVAMCRDTGARVGVAVKDCDLRTLRAAVALAQPYAIIVTEDVYRFDPEVFDSICKKAPASLVRLDSQETCAEARQLLVNAVFESAAAGPESPLWPVLG